MLNHETTELDLNSTESKAEEGGSSSLISSTDELHVGHENNPTHEDIAGNANNDIKEDELAVSSRSQSTLPFGDDTPQIAETTAPAQGQDTSDDKKPAGDTGVRFADLPLIPEVQKAVKTAGYEAPTPIQAAIIPHVLHGRDVLAQSQTGSGKTAAFALPILSLVEMQCRKPQVLVLVPTRELAIQVAKSFSTYGAHVDGFSVATIYGGQDYEIQFRQLKRGAQVVVGTPGRVIDHIKRGTLDVGEIECLVLDEADEMLNMGFLDDVEFVLSKAPKERQIALFSATLPKPIREISKRYLSDPAKVTIKQKTLTAESVRQRAVFVAPRDKVDLLIRFLEAEQADGVIVFTRTRETTTVVAEKLSRAGLSAVALNGEMPQRTRERTIQRLKAGQLDVLVATDVAARGLDVSRISHVINYDFPEGAESYTHRVGRTGRAGRAGQAIIFLSRTQKGKLKMIEKATRQPIEIVNPPDAKQINAMRIERFKDKIAATIDSEKLDFFKNLVEQFQEQSDHPPELIAAAIAHMGQQGRDFLMKDRPIREKSDRGGKQRREGGRGPRDRSSDTPRNGMTRYRIAVGKRDGVRPGNIVGAVTNEGGIDGGEIGPIRIHQSYSTIDLPADLGSQTCDALQETRVAGRPLKLRLADAGDDGRSEPRRRDYSKGGKANLRGSKRKGRGSTSAGNKPGNFAKRKKKFKKKGAAAG